ncbi:AfsR/SARP family transcriptional regulator [Micromonospora marina]|uniref:AfsR/SARP family transcriptional regulator n=1 Tax=Micromonospora marina TaxID=307120 RepID=UPI003453DC71
MKIRILGGLTAYHEGGSVHLGTPKQQLVLGMLAVHAGRLVTLDKLVDELWPDSPPRSAVPNVRTYAANLRRMFADADGEAVVARQPGGYQLLISPDAVDLARIERQITHGKALADAGQASAAIRVLTDAVDNWSGSLLPGLPLGPVLSARREVAEREHEAALVFLAGLHLSSGQPEDATRILRPHAARQPTRERLQAVLMDALLASGDSAGAAAVYRSTRAALNQELGVRPGSRLEELHRKALETGRRPPNPAERSAASSSPQAAHSARWLPRSTADFVGRQEVLDRLLRGIRRRSEQAAVIQVIDGMAGCGKTTVAVRLAEMLRAQHPDGQLFVDLRGHGETAALEPQAVLLTLLRQLGVPPGRVPTDFEDRAGELPPGPGHLSLGS